MHNPLLFFCLLVLPATAGAQADLVAQLASQVCRCMETNDRATPPAEQARECVRLVGLRHKRTLREELGLNPDNPVELNVLSERMADPLSRNCPVLSTLRLDDFERKRRWSDGKTDLRAATKELEYRFPKAPPADPSASTASEPPAVWKISGTITGRPGRGSLRLRRPDGEVQTLEFPAAVRRRVNLVEGQRVTAVCDREWRKSSSGGIVTLVVRTIE